MKVDKTKWEKSLFKNCVTTIKVKKAIQKNNYLSNGKYPIISQEKEFISGYCNNKKNLNQGLGEVVIFGDHTRILKFIDFDFCVGADGVKVLHPLNFIRAKYLYYFLKWIDIPSNGYSRHFKYLKEITIPYPSVNTQQNITTELDTVQKMIEGYKAQLADLDTLAQSIFLDMFGDPITNPKGWSKEILKNNAIIGTGATPSRKNPNFYNGNIPWVKSTEVRNCSISFTEEHINQDAIEHSNCSIYPIDTIILAMYGQGKTRGQVALLKIQAATNQACAAIQCKKQLNPIFTFWFFQLTYQANRKLGNGTNQKNMNLSIVGAIPLILPPLSLQQQFAERVEAIERQKELLQAQLAEAQTLMAERMQYYFD